MQKDSFIIKNSRKPSLKSRNKSQNHLSVQSLLWISQSYRLRKYPKLTQNQGQNHPQLHKHQAFSWDSSHASARRKKKDRLNWKPRKLWLWCTPNSWISIDCKRCVSQRKFRSRQVPLSKSRCWQKSKKPDNKNQFLVYQKQQPGKRRRRKRFSRMCWRLWRRRSWMTKRRRRKERREGRTTSARCWL